MINNFSDFCVPIRKSHLQQLIEHLQQKKNIEFNIVHGILMKIHTIPGSESSNFSFNFGNAGRNASGYRRNTLYIIKTAFIRRYGLVELI